MTTASHTATLPMIVVTGPTACGKTRRAVELARHFNGEIVSADSRQLYRGMDLGTGKDIDEYRDVPVHMIDVAPAGERLNLFNFLELAYRAIDDIKSRGRLPIICGGSGMYVEALLNNLKLPQVPENKELRASLEGKALDELTAILASMKQLHNTTDVDTVKRAIRAIEIATYYAEHPHEALTCEPNRDENTLVLALDIDRESRRRRITQRLDQRIAQGLVEECRMLLDTGLLPEDLVYYGLEYKFVALHLTGELTLGQMRDDLETAIHQFAKRQMTWFRGMERRGITLHWIKWDVTPGEFLSHVEKLANER